MGDTSARVDGTTLVTAGDEAGPITVGTPAWFAWLADATAFTFTGPAGSFMARKEQRTRGGGYWQAYRTAHGTLHKAYLGKLKNLTLARLEQAALILATAATPTDPLPVAPPSGSAAMPSTYSPPSSLSRPRGRIWCRVRTCSIACSIVSRAS